MPGTADGPLGGDRSADPRDITSGRLGPIDWTVNGGKDGLAAVYEYATRHGEEVVAWYNSRKARKKRWGFICRIAGMVLAAIGAIWPVFVGACSPDEPQASQTVLTALGRLETQVRQLHAGSSRFSTGAGARSPTTKMAVNREIALPGKQAGSAARAGKAGDVGIASTAAKAKSGGGKRSSSGLGSPLVASILLAFAALLVAIDRFADLSSGWMRYVTTAQKVDQKLTGFRLAWEASEMEWQGGAPSAEQLKKQIEMATAFQGSVHQLVEEETREWVASFSAVLKETMRGSERRTGPRPGGTG